MTKKELTQRMDALNKYIISASNKIPDINIPNPGAPTIIIDPGHGGMINGRYVTEPNKMSSFSDYGEFYEGVYNRAIAWSLAARLYHTKKNYILTVWNTDMPLRKRVNFYNNNGMAHKRVYVHSIHGNYFGVKDVTGIEVYTSPGLTPSDPIATIYYRSLTKLGWKMRPAFGEGGPGKEARFTILTETTMPAILTETGFYSNPSQARQMAQIDTVHTISALMYEAHDEVVTLNLI